VRPTAPPPPVPQAAACAAHCAEVDSRRPLSQPEYPPSSRRAGEAGTVILEVYVLENGRVGERA
jgi:outer membrane biosynthesis protein TonB